MSEVNGPKSCFFTSLEILHGLPCFESSILELYRASNPMHFFIQSQVTLLSSVVTDLDVGIVKNYAHELAGEGEANKHQGFSMTP